MSPAALVAARELFRQGTEDVDAGRFAEGLEKFRRVAAVKETPAVRFNIARCEESLNKPGAALADFELAEREAKADSTHAADDVAKLAREHADALRPKVPRLSVVAPAPAPEGMTVSLDGARVGPGSFGVPLPVDPGAHVVDATAPGRSAFRSEVTLAAGQSKEVAVVFAPAATTKGDDTPPPPPSEQASPSRGSAQRTIGWITVGAGGALLLTSGVFLLRHNSAVSDLNALCPDNACHTTSANAASVKQQSIDLLNRANSAQTTSIVFAAAAGAFVTTGLVLVLTAPSSPQQPAPAAYLVPGAAGAPAGLSLHATF